jgi:hypothetical protein
MQPITSQKARKRATRDAQLIEQQVHSLRKEKEIAIAAFDKAEGFLVRQLKDVLDAIANYDVQASAQQKLEEVR